MQDGDIPLNQCTLYVNNLNDAIHPDAMQRKLVPVFERFGKILNVVAMKSLFRRGQMFVCFANPAPAARALEELQGRLVFGKPMQIAFAKTACDASLKHTGLPISRTKKPQSTAVETQEKLVARLEAKEANNPSQRRISIPIQIRQHPVQGKRSNYQTPPNKTLFVENIPTDATADEVSLIFSSYSGFVSARVIAVRAVAFIDFAAEFNATVALAATDGREFRPGVNLVVQYAKK